MVRARIVVAGPEFAVGYDQAVRRLGRNLTDMGWWVQSVDYVDDVQEAVSVVSTAEGLLTVIVVDDEDDKQRLEGAGGCEGNHAVIVTSGDIASGAVEAPGDYRSTALRVIGLSADAISRQLAGISVPGVDMRIVPADQEVAVVIRGQGEFAAARVAAADQSICHRLGRCVYGRDEETLASVVAGMLLDRALTISCAESCTAGLLSTYLTSVPGSSDFFIGGVVCYDNGVKERIVGVDGGILQQYGAVSEPVAAALAIGVRQLLDSDIGVSITGIAGPGGAVSGKPVGTVFIATVYEDDCRTQHMLLSGNREQIRTSSALAALNMIRQVMMELT